MSADNNTAQSQDIAPDSAKEGAVRCTLKWFNAAKGFGFVIPEDNPADAFLHITQLQKIGFHGLGEGAIISAAVEYGDKGAIVREVFEVIDKGAIQSGQGFESLQYNPANEAVNSTKGIVKLYRTDKGFCFIIPDDGMKDIFVHKSCLDKDNIAELQAGQRVRVTFKTAMKGREAVSIAIEETP